MAVDATGGIILVVIVQKFNSVHFPLSEYKGCYKELCSKVRLKQLWFPRKLQKKKNWYWYENFIARFKTYLAFGRFIVFAHIERNYRYHKKLSLLRKKEFKTRCFPVKHTQSVHITEVPGACPSSIVEFSTLSQYVSLSFQPKLLEGWVGVLVGSYY